MYSSSFTSSWDSSRYSSLSSSTLYTGWVDSWVEECVKSTFRFFPATGWLLEAWLLDGTVLRDWLLDGAALRAWLLEGNELRSWLLDGAAAVTIFRLETSRRTLSWSSCLKLGHEYFLRQNKRNELTVNRRNPVHYLNEQMLISLERDPHIPWYWPLGQWRKQYHWHGYSPVHPTYGFSVSWVIILLSIA